MCAYARSRMLLVLLGAALIIIGAADAVRLNSISGQEKVSILSCPTTPLAQCDFYFEGYLNKPPVISLAGPVDTAVGPVLVDSHTGKAVNVGDTGAGSIVCNGGTEQSSIGRQFYLAGQGAQLHFRSFNQPPKSAVENKCVVLPLLSVQTNGTNLNPNDNNEKLYLTSRRCVLFATGPRGSCSSSSPPSSPPAKKQYFPALFAFGDSILDIGNNNGLKDLRYTANRFPYGIDYSPASGRFSNGKAVMDYFGELSGLTTVNKFADLNATNFGKFATGINFASAGSAAYTSIVCLKETACTNFDTQLGSFKKISAKYTKEKLAKSLFVISTGGNDYFAYAANPAAYNLTEFVTNVVTSITTGIQTLYASGARKFLVIGIPNAGCSPYAFAYLNSSTTTPQCNVAVSQLAAAHNTALKAATASLNSATVVFPGIKIVFADGAKMTLQLVANAKKYGFTDVTDACCGGGAYNAQIICGLPGSSYCSNRGNHMFWDYLHLTQKGWSLTADAFFNGKYNTVSPYGVKFLAA